MSEPEQLGFAMEGMEGPPPRIDPHVVRLELEAILAQARQAQDCMPWDHETYRRYRATFPEKTKVLPPEEAEFMRRQFVLEFDRIAQLLAA